MYHKMSDFYSKELIEACKPYENVKFEEEEWEEESQPTADVIQLDRIKQLREEIDKLADDSVVWGILANAEDSDIDAITEKINECYRAMIFPLIDKLIAEVEMK